MLSRSLGIASLVSITLGCLGCADGRFSFSYYDHKPRPVRVTHVHRHARHVCTHDCHDCYWNGVKVVMLTGHRHGHGCGHVWDGGNWVIARKVNAKRMHPGPAKVKKVRHVHGPSCGCAYNRHGHKWVKIKRGHVHGPGCGHVYIEARWTFRH